MGTKGSNLRQYYSSRKGRQPITLQQAHWRLLNLYLLFRDKDYFKENFGVTEHYTPKRLAREAVVRLGFTAFPINEWVAEAITEDHIFDVIEFLHDHASKPGRVVEFSSETDSTYHDYESYDEKAGKAEFRDSANLILVDMGEGFELGLTAKYTATVPMDCSIYCEPRSSLSTS